jgi:hypothetical protein
MNPCHVAPHDEIHAGVQNDGVLCLVGAEKDRKDLCHPLSCDSGVLLSDSSGASCLCHRLESLWVFSAE